MAALHLAFHTGVHSIVAVGKIYTLEREHALAAAFGLREMKPFHPAILALRCIHQIRFQTINLLLLAFGLCGLGVLRPKPIHEGLEVIDLPLLILMRGQLLRFMRVALLQERIVITRPAKQLLTTQLKDTVHQLIEKLAVVRNHQDRPRIILQIPLHPDQRL